MSILTVTRRDDPSLELLDIHGSRRVEVIRATTSRIARAFLERRKPNWARQPP